MCTVVGVYVYICEHMGLDILQEMPKIVGDQVRLRIRAAEAFA